MLIGEPAPSAADLHFRILGFPVRIHPFFWLAMLLLGMSGGPADPLQTLVWVAVGLVSILVHELGHAVLQRRFGGEPRIVLYSFGGLAICDDCDRSPGKQIAISLAGPLAGFAFAVAVALAIRAAGHPIGFTTEPRFVFDAYLIPVIVGQFYFAAFDSPGLNVVIGALLSINIWWGILNLLPVYPLDGGQVARELCILRGNPRHGIITSLWISIFTAAAVAAYALFQGGKFTIIFFALMAYSNYQVLQNYRQRGY